MIGDFNIQLGNKTLKDFCDLNQLEYLILKPTCYKGKTSSTSDLIITNHKSSFMKYDTCETGLSNHHKIVHSFLRKTFAKGKPKTIYYQCYKNFEQNKFNKELKKRISIDLSFVAFLEIFQSTLARFTPYKQKKVRYNNNPFITKLRNEFNKSRTSENWKKYKQQRNKCLSILKGTKTNYFNNVNPKFITDNKKFWSSVKPLFLDKSKAKNTIVLYGKGKIMKNYKRVSEVLNKYFRNLTKSLRLKKCISKKSFLNTSTKKINQLP